MMVPDDSRQAASLKSDRRSIWVVGAGYVGLTTAVWLAMQGHSVLCLEQDIDRLNALRAGQLPFYEPGLEAVFQQVLASGDLALDEIPQDSEALPDAVFLCVGTPTHVSTGLPCTAGLFQAAQALVHRLPNPTDWVVKSTVPPGTCRNLSQALNGWSGLSHAVVHIPEFLVQGQAWANMQHPQRVVLGGNQWSALVRLRRLFQPWWEQGVPCLVVAAETAELGKLAANSALATKISWMNDLAALCSVLEVDSAEVAQVVGSDPRIGPWGLQAGLGFGGSCLPKDLLGLLTLGQQHQTPLPVLEAVQVRNQWQPQQAVNWVRSQVAKGGQLAVWGLTFKAGTDDLRDSPAVRVVQLLLEAGYRVTAYDPLAKQPDVTAVLPTLTLTAEPEHSLFRAEALLVLTDDPRWQGTVARWQALASQMAVPQLLDARNLLQPQVLQQAGWRYTGFGRVPPSESSVWIPADKDAIWSQAALATPQPEALARETAG